MEKVTTIKIEKSNYTGKPFSYIKEDIIKGLRDIEEFILFQYKDKKCMVLMINKKQEIYINVFPSLFETIDYINLNNIESFTIYQYNLEKNTFVGALCKRIESGIYSNTELRRSIYNSFGYLYDKKLSERIKKLYKNTTIFIHEN